MDAHQWKRCTRLTCLKWIQSMQTISNHPNFPSLMHDIYPGRVTSKVSSVVPSYETLVTWCRCLSQDMHISSLLKQYCLSWSERARQIDASGTTLYDVLSFAARVEYFIFHQQLFAQDSHFMSRLMSKRILDAILPFPVFCKRSEPFQHFLQPNPTKLDPYFESIITNIVESYTALLQIDFRDK
jgi:hypothetical protein